MLYWSIVFFVVALVAGALGLGGISGTAADIAQFLFWAAIVLFAITLVGGLLAGRKAKDVLT
jgi:uncharacterized membrane protein YtjA (UPF0391 family)